VTLRGESARGKDLVLGTASTLYHEMTDGREVHPSQPRFRLE
jgi:hypothetical protein